MDSLSAFVPNFCPACGAEVGEKDTCANCNKSIVFTADELNSTDKKYCYACGASLKPNSNICNSCGNELKITQATIHIQRGREFFDEGRKDEALVEAKKALALENKPEGRFMICGVIVSTQGDLLKERFLDKYGDLNYFPQEVIDSEEFQDILKHGKQALEELNKCTPDVRHKIEVDPKNNVQGIKQTVKEFSDAARNPRPSSPYQASEKKSGCFIATAVYGSIDSPEVLVLQKFRDNYLTPFSLGRLFIKTYYRFSPAFALWLHNQEKYRKYIRTFVLNSIIKFIPNK